MSGLRRPLLSTLDRSDFHRWTSAMASTPPRRRLPSILLSAIGPYSRDSKDLFSTHQVPEISERDDNANVPKKRHGSIPMFRRIAYTLLLLALVAVGMITMGVLLSNCPRSGTRCYCPGNVVTVVGDTSPSGYAIRPYYDLVVAVLVVGGDSLGAQAEIERVRRVYARYGDKILLNEEGTEALSFRYIFVVGKGNISPPVPESGLLLGDFFYVDVREGYTFLSEKTKAMMALSEHLSFRFLAKTDGDTYPCLSRVAQQLVELPPTDQRRVYAGLLATCGKVFPPGHKLHDPEFLKATGGVLPCHPMYHQGAFYVLGEEIVRHLSASRDLLTLMSVEDAMVGLWLLGINKVILDIGGQFYCRCFTHAVPRSPDKKESFYHYCKTDEKIDGCLKKFGVC